MPTAEETREALLDLFVGAIRGRDGQPDRFAAPRMPGGYSDQPAAGQHGGTWIEARALANFYANLFNDLQSAGAPPDEETTEEANDSLHEHGWAVEQNEREIWEARDLSQEEHEDGPMRHKRVPRDTPGAVKLPFKSGPNAGKAGPEGFYWVKTRDGSDPRAASAKRKKEYAENDKKGPAPSHAGVKEKIAALKTAHAEEGADIGGVEPELNETGKKKAGNTLNALKRVYGEHALHRLGEMTGWAEKALAALKNLPASDAYRQMVTRRLLNDLTKIHAMTEMASGAAAEKPDLSGSGEKTPAPEAAKTPEKPAETAPPAAKEGGAGKPTYPKDWGVMIPSYVSPEGKAKVVALLKAAEGASGATVKDMIADREAMTDARHGRSERTHAELNGLYTIKQAREKAGAWNDEPWPEAHAEPLDVSEETAAQPEAPPAKEETPAPTPVAEPAQQPAPAAQAPPAQDRQATVADAILDAAREGGASEVIVVQKVRDKVPDATIEEIRAAGRQLHKDGKVQIKGGVALLPGQDMPKATTKPVQTSPEDMRRLQEREKGLLKTRPGEEEGFPRPQSITEREKRTENPQNMSLATWRARHGYDRKNPAGKATIDQQHKSAVQEALALGEKPFAAKEYPDLKAAPKGVAPEVEHPPEIAGMAPGAIKAGAKAEQLVGKGHKALGDKGRGALHALQGMLGLVGAGPDGKLKGAPPPASVEEAEKALAGLGLTGLPPEEIRQVAKGLQIPGAESLAAEALTAEIRKKVLSAAVLHGKGGQEATPATAKKKPVKPGAGKPLEAPPLESRTLPPTEEDDSERVDRLLIGGDLSVDEMGPAMSGGRSEARKQIAKLLAAGAIEKVAGEGDQAKYRLTTGGKAKLKKEAADEVNAEIAARRKAAAETPPGQKPPNTVKPPRAKKAPPLPAGHSQWEESMRGKGAGEDDLATVREDLASGDPDQTARGRRLMQELEKDLGPEPEAIPAEEEETADPLKSADESHLPPSVQKLLAGWRDEKKPLGERIKRLGDVDTRIFDALYHAGHLTKENGFTGNNEVFRTLDGIVREYEASEKKPHNQKRLLQRIDGVELTIGQYAVALEDLAKKGVHVQNYAGEDIGPMQLMALSNLYESEGERAAREAKKLAGSQPRAKKTPAPAPAAPAEAEKESAAPAESVQAGVPPKASPALPAPPAEAVNAGIADRAAGMEATPPGEKLPTGAGSREPFALRKPATAHDLEGLTDEQLKQVPPSPEREAERVRRSKLVGEGDATDEGYDYGKHPHDAEYPEWKASVAESPGLTAYLNRAFFHEKPGVLDRKGRWDGPQRDAWEAKKTREYEDLANNQAGLFGEPEPASESNAPPAAGKLTGDALKDRILEHLKAAKGHQTYSSILAAAGYDPADTILKGKDRTRHPVAQAMKALKEAGLIETTPSKKGGHNLAGISAEGLKTAAETPEQVAADEKDAYTGEDKSGALPGENDHAGDTADEDAKLLEEPGPGSGPGGLPGEEPVGARPEAAPGAVLPGTAEGTPGERGGERLPDRQDELGAGTDALPDGAGGGAGGRPAGGQGEAAADSAGGTGPADGVGEPERGGLGGGGGRADTPGEESVASPPEEDNPTDVAGDNFRYDDPRALAKRSMRQKLDDNFAALRVLRNIEGEGRDTATPAEQAAMAKFVGWGQFKALFNTYDSPDWDTLTPEAQQELLAEQQKYGKEKRMLEEFLGGADSPEYLSARRSVLNAHYTHPDIVGAHWQIAERLGYKEGKFLETSAGIGYYLGMMPAHLAGKTRSSAVELDKITGRMAGLLYPKANVENKGFQHFKTNDNYFDLVASNVPFGAYGVSDPRYNKHGANIHDYFFLKSMDAVRPGGLVMHITSTGTLDKQDPAIRKELASKGDLVGAIRFPGGAHKENAGTDVVTDLLIFKKRAPGEAPSGDQSWLETTTVPDPAGGEAIPVNKYFADHPEQVLGTLDRTGKMYKGQSVNVSRTDDYEERLAAAIDRLPRDVMTRQAAPARRFSPKNAPKPGDTREGGFQVAEGKVFVRDGQEMVEQPVNAKTAARIEGILGVRDAVRAVINDQLDRRDATASRALLNKAYDAFVAKHGFLHSKENVSAFSTDPDYPMMMGLEHWDAKAKKATKSDRFHKDTIRTNVEVTHAGSVGDALRVSLHQRGSVDVEHMAKLTGHTAEDVGKHLVEKGLAYHDPSTGWQHSDQYLSGNVRRKLALAKAAAANDPQYEANVKALEKVQPEDVHHDQIEARMGAGWVPPADVREFAAHLLDMRAGGADQFDVRYSPRTGTWFMGWNEQSHGWERSKKSKQATQVWSAGGEAFKDLFEAALNNKKVKVYQEGPGNTRIIDPKATEDANAKIGEMKDAFKEWVWEDDSRRERLHRYYNDNFNNIRHMKYDGSHQTFPGMNPAVELRDHQKNFVWQVVTTGRGLAAHEVGTGKTYTMIAAAMELRRLGLAKKPCIVALKANIEDITANCLKLYPGAKILSTVDMFEGPQRKKAVARMASGDYDIVLMTHDHIGMLPMRPEVTEKYINNQIKELVAAKKEALKAEGEEEGPEETGAGRRGKGKRGGKQGNRVVAQIQKAIESLQKKLEDHLVASKKDDALTFEETGIDTLFVDECFPGETMIVTEEGLMPIGEIVENRLPLRVLSCNRGTHELEYKPVSSWFKRPLKNHLVRVTHEQGSFVCTPNHEVWTEEDGYVQAGLLESRHTLRCVPEGFRGQCLTGAGGEGEVLQPRVRRPWAVVARDQAVQAVRQGLHATGEGWRRSESVLLADLRQETSVGESGEEAKTQGCHAGGDHRGNPQGVVAADDGEQPDGRSGGSREGSAETAWQNLLEQGRQWPVDRSAEIAGIFPVLADGVQHCHGGGEGSLRMPAQRLQGGSGAPDAEDRGGDRRPDAQDAQVEVSRQAEDGGSVRSGVVRVALHQRAGEQRTFAGGVGDSCVYDLEVEGNHNYFADGVNVSNCHKFKSLPVVSKHRDIKGVPTQESDRAALMHMRTQWLLEQNNGRGVVFATGTPVANTMAELYNMQRYLQPEELKERGIENFDAWSSAFGDVQTKQEFTVTGDYKSVSRFARFVNIPEMQQITRQIMDVQRADDMVDAKGKSTIIRPPRKDHVVKAPFTPAMEALMQSLKERAKALKKSWQPGKGEDNMLAICNDGRKGALDMRLLDASAPDDPTSKVNQCLARVQEIRKNAPAATQLIFLDAGVNPTDDGFHLYGDVIDKLVASGIPRERIADFSKLEGKKKEQAQEEMREGKILIGIGSTDKLGTGVNVQDKLAALHHLDTPRDYTPAGVEQRDGRGWRQGNKNMIDPETGKVPEGLQDHIAIHRYISEKSLDAFMWQLMGNKDKFIKQVITQDIDKNLRHAREEDVEELSFDQLMAIATGNPQVLEKVNLEDEVKQLTSARNRHEREQIKFKDTAAAVERNLPHLEKRAQALHADAAFLDRTPGFHMVVGGVEYTDREKARDAVKKHLEDNKDALSEVRPWRPFLVGVYRGVPVQMESNSGYMKLMVPGGGSYEASTTMRAVEHVAGNIAKHAAEADHDVAQAKEDVVKLRKNIGKTFAKGSELEAKRARVKEIEAELAKIGKEDEPGKEIAQLEKDEPQQYRRARLARCYARLSRQAALRGDRASARIYAKASRESR